MIKSTIEKMADPIGFEIGASDDQTQSALLNGFCRGLANSIQEAHAYESQICALVEHLDSKSHAVIKEIAEFIKLKEGERP
jgi:hypothetical protein